ncbi:hypothetical protein DXT87_18050 [Arthrobacter sp. AET 35A]|nr:hypothetical protein [Arthrobacter sp. AET 35A]
MPRGERLADSRKTEGWSRGFTPKSTDKGPEYVEIRLKDNDEDTESGTSPDDPRVAFSSEPVESTRQKSPEQEEVDELLRLLVTLALVKGAQWAQPRLRLLWNELVIPFFDTKRNRWQERKARLKTQRRAGKQGASEVPTLVNREASAEESVGVSSALEAYKANMTSDEALQHFAELLVAQRFAAEKMLLLANARIKDGGLPPELATAVRALTPEEVKKAMVSILASQPTVLDDLVRLLETGHAKSQSQLGRNRIRATLRLTDG